MYTTIPNLNQLINHLFNHQIPLFIIYQPLDSNNKSKSLIFDYYSYFLYVYHKIDPFSDARQA
jgi:hypothetical protein